jgi:hypothetical protein
MQENEKRLLTSHARWQEALGRGMVGKSIAKHTAAGIPTWSPTVVLICRSTAYVWQSGRDAQFSADCGRMYWICFQTIIYKLRILSQVPLLL